MRTRRSIDDIIGLELRNQPSVGRTHKKRAKVPCYCNDCNGKLVLKRTKLLHESSQSQSTTDPLDEMQQDPINPTDEMQQNPTDPTNEMQQDPTGEMQQEDPVDTASEGEPEDQNRQINYEDSEYLFLPRKRRKRHTNRSQVASELTDNGSESSIAETSNYTSGAKTNDEAIVKIFEDYLLPLHQDPIMEEEITNDEQFTWILL